MTIYFDHNATTPLHPRALDAMLAVLRGRNANPSGLYRDGRAARALIDDARAQVAALVGAQPDQVVFTSGGTEANNLALKGMATRRAGATLLTTPIEHPSVSETLTALTRAGTRCETLPVDRAGLLDQAALEQRLARGDVGLVTCMWANNETGVVQDIPAIAAAVRAAGALLHSDAVQAAGKLALDYRACGAHSISLSAHKLYGPRGVGALVLDKGVDIDALHHGGGHEGGLRGGTENTAAIVGFGVAAECAASELAERSAHVLALREHLEAGLNTLPGVVVFGAGATRLPNTAQFSVPGYDGESLLMALDGHGIAVSSGSACASGSGEPSPVLVAMGVDPALARGAIRVSLGRENSAAQIDRFLDVLTQLAGGQAAMPGINPAVLNA